jgi:hypothetical protein
MERDDNRTAQDRVVSLGAFAAASPRQVHSTNYSFGADRSGQIFIYGLFWRADERHLTLTNILAFQSRCAAPCARNSVTGIVSAAISAKRARQSMVRLLRSKQSTRTWRHSALTKLFGGRLVAVVQ